ncbi:hypothetical protein PRIC1_006728 [Phytophthora ramorum]
MLGLHQYREKVEKPTARADISNPMLMLVNVEEAVKARNHLYGCGMKGPRQAAARGARCAAGVKFVHKGYCCPLWVTSPCCHTSRGDV